MINNSLVIHKNISLADKNWFKTGGNASHFCEPTTSESFSQALLFAKEQSLPIFMLGQGANILISDEGFNGLVIKPALNSISHQDVDDKTVLVQAGSGVSMDDLISYCLRHQIGGLEEFSGIPGTVGGSVFINLHYFEFLLSNFLVSAHVVHKNTGALELVDNAWFNFGYNQSTLISGQWYLVDATFRLKKLDALQTSYAQGRRAEIIRHRTKRYPNQNTCGSFFRNFYPNEVSLKTSEGKPLIFIAYYLDKIGAKGSLKSGGALVSHQHANMIVNMGNARSSDIINLARTMQELVFNHFGIIPQPECRLIGFSQYPLL